MLGKDVDGLENKELLNIMEKCGHFLYHRRGVKRGQLKVLNYLREKGSVTQKELGEVLILKSGTVSEVVKKLEAQGFISREKDSVDKRKTNLTITKQGTDFLEERLLVIRAQEKVLFDVLSKEEQEQLEKLLLKLFSDWESRFDSALFNHREEREKC